MDIDALIKRFRLASRDLFNHYFHHSTHDAGALDGNERFDEVEESLFRAMVTWPAGLAEIPYLEPQPEIEVTSQDARDIPCIVNRNAGLWEMDTLPNGARLIFVRFFDFDELDFRDNSYVMGEVINWPGNASLKGTSVLVEPQYVKFNRVKPQDV